MGEPIDARKIVELMRLQPMFPHANDNFDGCRCKALCFVYLNQIHTMIKNEVKAKSNQAVRSLGRHLNRVIWSLVKHEREYTIK